MCVYAYVFIFSGLGALISPALVTTSGAGQIRLPAVVSLPSTTTSSPPTAALTPSAITAGNLAAVAAAAQSAGATQAGASQVALAAAAAAAAAAHGPLTPATQLTTIHPAVSLSSVLGAAPVSATGGAVQAGAAAGVSAAGLASTQQAVSRSLDMDPKTRQILERRMLLQVSLLLLLIPASAAKFYHRS